MTIQMNDSQLTSLVQIEKFLNNSNGFAFERKTKTRQETYVWIEETLIKFGYMLVKKK